MGFDRYATLGHSYGAFVVLQQAVDRPGHAAATIVSSGAAVRALPRRGRGEPRRLRAGRAARAGDASRGRARPRRRRRRTATTLLHDQLPFHFADPRDPRIAEFERRTARDGPRARRAAPLRGRRVRRRSRSRTGSARSPQPVLVLAGRHDRTCVVEAAEAIAAGIRGARARRVRGQRPLHLRRGERGLPRARCGASFSRCRRGGRRRRRGPAGCSRARRARGRSPRRRWARRGARRARRRAPRARRRGRRSAGAGRRAP